VSGPVLAAAPPGESDEVRAAQAGDRRAQRALFDRHQRAVFGYCLLSTHGDRERALDLLQETFARVFASLASLDDPGRFRGWLFIIAANVCRTRGGQDERRQSLLEALRLEQQADDDGDLPEHRERRIDAVRRVLSQVTDSKLRKLVMLKYGEPEHTTREIAARLAIPHGTVTVKLMRFRAAIRRQLCNELASEGVRP
jgi:RNA polymerase sigma factor (sigma-70 family)